MLFSSVLSLTTVVASASVSPVKIEKQIVISRQSCTVIVYGIYTEPYGLGYTDVSCAKTAGDCLEARSLATDCRNQKICARLAYWGFPPQQNLGCKVDGFENP